jgi:DNA-binding response OmpR family regulator
MAKKKVLIVDDERDLREALGAMVEAEGFEVLSAKDGAEGLETALKEKPDLILLDIVMPKMDGFEVLDKLREDEWGKKVQVIFLTVLEDMESVSRAIAQGGHEYLVKTDWALEEVAKKIREKLGV